MTEQHECGCSHFPGPHDVDARHPNPRACEHAEMPVDLIADAVHGRELEEALAWLLHVPVVDVLSEARKLNALHRRTAEHMIPMTSDASMHRVRADLDSVVDPSL